jgi:hypothetical protein
MVLPHGRQKLKAKAVKLVPRPIACLKSHDRPETFNLLPGIFPIAMMKNYGFVTVLALQSLGLRIGDGHLDNNREARTKAVVG